MNTRRFTSGILTLAGLALAGSAFAQYSASPSPNPSGSTGSSATGSTSTTTRSSTSTIMSQNSYDARNAEIVAVSGNQVVVKSTDGYRMLTVAPDYRFTINGQPMSTTQIKPGMTVNSTIQTTTSPVMLTSNEMRDAQVVSASGGTVVIKDESGQQKTLNSGDFRNMDVVIMKDGRPVMATDLKTGDRVTAVMLTQGTSTGSNYPSSGTSGSMGSMTGSTSGTTGSTTGASGTGTTGSTTSSTTSTTTDRYSTTTPRPSTGSAAGSNTGSTTGSSDVASSSTYQDDTSARQRNLPKTASPWPLVGLAGIILLGIGGAVTLARRLSLG